MINTEFDREYVGYISDNRLLVIAGERQLDKVLANLQQEFRIFWLPFQQEMVTDKGGVEVISTTENSALTGYLGSFSFADNPGLVFDQVLDFSEQPLIKSRIAPFGYYSVTENDDLPELLQQITDGIGEFDKPKYFNWEAEKCAHQRNAITGCSRCIEVCATDAITSEDGRVVINPYLCQGCGDCTSVCPSGAVSYQYPTRVESLLAIRQKLKHSSAAVLFYSGDLPEMLTHTQQTIHCFEVEGLGSVGLDICLNALAFGASNVLILDSGELTPETRATIQTTVVQAREILTGLGYSEGRVQFVSAGEWVLSNPPEWDKASYQPDADKRTAIRMATDFLRQFSASEQPFCQLSEPSAFGTVQVNTAACTLCMACVSGCPAQALEAGGEYPQLKFIEALCVQCGICRQTCPEHAIALQPRYYYDSTQARKKQLLFEEEPFCCIVCQKPFAPASMINIILQKLQHHPMFAGNKKQQLMMCEDCKVIKMFDKS